VTRHRKLLELASIVGMSAALAMLGGCDNDGPLENAAEEVDDAIDDTADDIEDAADDLGDEIDDATDGTTVVPPDNTVPPPTGG